MKAYFRRLYEDIVLALAPEKYALKLAREWMEREEKIERYGVKAERWY